LSYIYFVNYVIIIPEIDWNHFTK